MQPVNLMANIGTPFVWGGCFMLIFGNALIGYIEAWVLQRRYGIPIRKTSRILIATNFVTGLLGLFILPSTLSFWQKLSEPLIFYFSVPFLILTWLLTFGATVLAEWPMFRWAIQSSEHGPHPFKATFLANLISYGVLFFLSIPVSNYSGARLLKGRTAPFKMSRKPPDATLFCYDLEAAKLLTISVSDAKLQSKIDISQHRIPIGMREAAIVAKTPTGKFRLLYSRSNKGPEFRTLVQNLDVVESQVEILNPSLTRNGWIESISGPLSFRRFSIENPPEYKVSNHYWAGYSFDVRETRSGNSFSLALESPFLSWYWQNPILLPDGWCIAELNGKVWLIDIKTKEIALLSKGKGAA